MLGQKTIPSRLGGVEVVAEELSTGMAKRGNAVTCYNRREPEDALQKASGQISIKNGIKEYKGVRLKEVFTLPKKGLAAASASAAASVYAAFGPYDIVHFHAEGPCATIWLPKLMGKHVVATIHGLDWKRSKWGKFASAYLKFGERMAARFADEVIVLSRDMQQYFLKEYGRKTIYIPNGIRTIKQRKANLIHTLWGLEGNDYILYVGRIVPEKGLHHLLRVFKTMNTDSRLVIAGTASGTKKYFEQVKEFAKDDPRIIFTGFVQGEALEELYSNAAVYCLPSDLEGMPLTLLEAMSCGRCCVTSDIPECTETLKGMGYVFQRGNTAELKEKLEFVLQNPEAREKYSNALIREVKVHHSWDAVVEQTLTVYDRVSEKKIQMESAQQVRRKGIQVK